MNKQTIRVSSIATATKRAKFTRLGNGDSVMFQAGAMGVKLDKTDANSAYSALLGKGFKVIDKQGVTVFLHS